MNNNSDLVQFKSETRLKIINLDRECEADLRKENGFIITSDAKSVKKALNDVNGIYSSNYGQTLNDMNPFIDRYKCSCGESRSRVNLGMRCKKCGTTVEFIDDNFGYFGWFKLKPAYTVIHPVLYKSLEFLIGQNRLLNMITFNDPKDPDGRSIPIEKYPKDEPFFGIGILETAARIDEILIYYRKRFPAKAEYVKFIRKNMTKLFTHSIPVYTTLLRPFALERDVFSYNGANEKYAMMAKLVNIINNDSIILYRKLKSKNQLLLDLQLKWNELYKEIIETLKGKKGTFRTLFGGRYNFTARNVIVPDPEIEVDQVTLPYTGLVELLQGKIINILKKSYSMTYDEAYKVWYKASIHKSKMVWDIIQNIIDKGVWIETSDGGKEWSKGIPVLINRNPSINFGSLQQVFCIAINDNYTMGIPLQDLNALAADFDGDVLNILLIINKEFLRYSYAVYNPKNAMFISRNDGMFNSDFNHFKDNIINLNTFIFMTRDNYTDAQLIKIRDLKAKYK